MRVLPGQGEHQGLDVPSGHRPAGPCRAWIWRPSGAARCRGASQDGTGGDQQPQAPGAALWVSTLSRAADSARSAQFTVVRRGCRRCRTAGWWRRIKISAVCHAASRRDSRSHAPSRVSSRNTDRRHMIGDHHGRSAGRATLLVRAMDRILGTHSVAAPKQHGAHLYEVDRQNAVGLRGQELLPRRTRATRRGVDPCVMQDLPQRGGCDRVAKLGELALHPPVTSRRVVRGRADHELVDRGCRGRSSGMPSARVVPFARGQVPGEQCRRGYREHLAPPVPGDQPGQGRKP